VEAEGAGYKTFVAVSITGKYLEGTD
jgi:hypothetical protein